MTGAAAGFGGRVASPWGPGAQGPGFGGELPHLPQGLGAKLAAGGGCALRDKEGTLRAERGRAATWGWGTNEGRPRTMAGGWRFCLGQAEVRTGPVLRLLSLGIPIPTPGSLLPATRLLNQPGRGPRPCHRGRPQRSSRGHSPALALSHPGLASPPPPHTHTTHTHRPLFAKGAAPWSADKGPWSVARAAESLSGAHAPHWLPSCARMELGGGAGRAQGGGEPPEQRPGRTGGPRKD